MELTSLLRTRKERERKNWRSRGERKREEERRELRSVSSRSDQKPWEKGRGKRALEENLVEVEEQKRFAEEHRGLDCRVEKA